MSLDKFIKTSLNKKLNKLVENIVEDYEKLKKIYDIDKIKNDQLDNLKNDNN
jgi:hypothetical protein